jgi:PAS domain S-box-containing protein
MFGPLEDLLSGTRGPLPDAVREELGSIHRNALRLLKLVNGLLDFARIEAGRAEAAYEPVDLALHTAELAGMFRSTIERAGLRFHVECPPLPAPVYVDRDMWEKIVLNLVSNAFKFTFEGEIGVYLRWLDGAVELEVRDTGIGITREELAKIFQRFHRVQGARARTHEGSGIGLSLVQDLLRLHGGVISAESEVGRGSSFKAKVLAGRAHLPDEKIGAARKQVSTAIRADAFVEEAARWSPDDHMPTRVLTPPPATASILIADDNADMRDYLRRILGTRWRVDAVANGIAALELARQTPPDLVITDVMMPDLDGFGLLRALRADEKTRHVPVMMLSARAGEEARVEGLDSGADDYLIKPFSARELIARVGVQLSQERSRLYATFAQTPSPICVLRGAELLFEMSNARYREAVGRATVDGRTLREIFPELGADQGWAKIAADVMRGGQAHLEAEALIRFDRRGDGTLEDSWWRIVCSPLELRDGAKRVIMVLVEVTEHVIARRKLELFTDRLQSALETRDETLARMDALLASAPIGLAFFDRHLRYERISDAMAELNGLSPAKTVGRKIGDILTGGLGNLVESYVRQTFENGRTIGPFEVSFPPPTTPASMRHWLLIYYPVRDARDRVVSVGALVIDITSQKRAEREAELQKEHLRSLFMQVPTPMLILRGPKHVIELANSPTCKLWGKTQEEVINRPILEVLPRLEGEGFGALLDGVYRTGVPYVGKEHLAQLDTGQVYFNFVYAPLFGVDGAVEGVLVIAFDVSEEILARNHLRQTVHYNEMFAGILGHDLRNPLNAVMTDAQLLMRRAPEERISGPSRRILTSGERMKRMIDQLLDFSRLRVGGGIDLDPAPIVLAELLRQAVGELEVAHPLRKIVIESNGDTRGEWDPDRLAQVFSNLAANAIHHGAADAPVVIRADGASSSSVQVTFENHGAIAGDMLPILFEPFRGAKHKQAGSKGLGLGLFITREIIVAHRGTIEVKSTLEQGTRFTITLPRQRS